MSPDRRWAAVSAFCVCTDGGFTTGARNLVYLIPATDLHRPLARSGDRLVATSGAQTVPTVRWQANDMLVIQPGDRPAGSPGTSVLDGVTIHVGAAEPGRQDPLNPPVRPAAVSAQTPSAGGPAAR